MAIENLKICILPGIDQILVEYIKAGSRKIHSETHKPTNSIRSKEELPRPWKKSIILPIQKKENQTDCSNNRLTLLLSNTYKN
jgi:hypothetical protein